MDQKNMDTAMVPAYAACNVGRCSNCILSIRNTDSHRLSLRTQCQGAPPHTDAAKKQIQRPIAIISGNQSLSRYRQKAFRKTGRDAKYYPRIWRFRASKLSWLKSCSIRQASAEAVSGETPRSTSHWLIRV